MLVKYSKLALMCQSKPDAVQNHLANMKPIQLQKQDLAQADLRWKQIEDVRNKYKKEGWKNADLVRKVNKETGAGQSHLINDLSEHLVTQGNDMHFQGSAVIQAGSVSIAVD